MEPPENREGHGIPSGLTARLRAVRAASKSLQMRRTRANLTAIVGVNLLALATGPVLARGLGPSDRGALAAAFLWPELVSLVVGLGLNDAVTYFSSRADISPRSVLRCTNRLTIIQGLATWALGVPVVYLTMRHFGSSAVISALIYLAAMPANLYSTYLLSLLNGLHRYRSFNVIFLQLFAVTAVGYVVLFAAGELTVRTAVIVNDVSILSTVGAGWVVTRRCLERAPALRKSVVTRQFLSFGARSWASAVPHQLNDKVDQLVISLVLPARQLGLYAVAATIAAAPGFLGVAVATSMLPTVASTRSSSEQLRAARHAILLTFGITLAAGLVVLLLIHPVIAIIFGRAFLGGAAAARVLALAVVMLSVTRVFHGVLKGLGRPLAAAISEAGALLVTAVGLAALLPLIGILGAAITSLVAYTTSTLIAAGLTSAAMGIRPMQLLWPSATASAEGR